MSNKTLNIVKILFAIIILVSSITIQSEIYEAGELMFDLGYEMADLRSQAGTSVAEHYYQLHGAIYCCFGKIFSVGSYIILIAGITVALNIIYPIIKENGEKIKDKVNTIKNTTQRVAQVISQEPIEKPASVPTPVYVQTTEAIEVQTTENIFCTKCGSPISHNMDFCTKCGNKIDK